MNMKTCLIVSLVAAGLLASAGETWAAPEIAHVTEPACNGEVIVITGEGLDGDQLRVKAAYLPADDGSFDPQKLDEPEKLFDAIEHRPEVPGVPPEHALDCPILGRGKRYMQVQMRSSRHVWARAPVTTALWVGDGQAWSRPYLVNRPQAQWLSPRRQAPGEVVRIFGRTFSWGWNLGHAQAYLRKVGDTQLIALPYAGQHHEDGHTERWCHAAWLPNGIEPGEYDVFLHGRHGGPWGWSDPLRLTVAAEPFATGPVVNVKDLGAKGDGLTDDTAALESALKKAANPEQPGVVFLPAGVYAVSRTLTLPEHVVVRGESVEQSTITNYRAQSLTPGVATDKAKQPFRPALLHGKSHFVLQDLTVRFMPATAPALQIGQDMQYVENVTLYRVRIEARQGYSLAQQHDYTIKPVVIYNSRNLRMIRCETFGPGGVGCDRKLEDCQFSQNRFLTDRRWRGSGFKFWGAERCIFEDNLLQGDTRGLVMQTHFGVNYRNFIAGNRVERTTLGGNAGETYLVEGAGVLYESPVGAASADTISTTQWPTAHTGSPFAEFHQKIPGRFAVIARGRGLGQWRRIAAADDATKTLTVERPWRVVPDESSTVVVMNGLIDTVFVNNEEVDCAKGLYIYGAGAINNIVDRHIADRGLGITLMTHDERQDDDPAKHSTAPDFFNRICSCRVTDGGGIFLSVGGRLPFTDDVHLPLANFGNRVLHNEVQRTRPFNGAQYDAMWRAGGGFSDLAAAVNLIPMDLGRQPGQGLDGPARMVGNVVQDNYLVQCPFGVGISKRAAGTLLYRNVYQMINTLLIDNGTDTQTIDDEIRDNQQYTPERGPIR